MIYLKNVFIIFISKIYLFKYNLFFYIIYKSDILEYWNYFILKNHENDLFI
jgi:hypothetical protein